MDGESVSGWDSLIAGDYNAAITKLTLEVEEGNEGGSLGNLGYAYLCAGQPSVAHTQFTRQCNVTRSSARVHCSLGTASWLCNNRERAVIEWRKALKCQYADVAGGVEAPLLLYYASVVSDLVEVSEAAQILANALRRRRAKPSKWLVALGLYVLGEQERPVLEEWTVSSRGYHKLEREIRWCFYSGIKALERGDSAQFADYVRRCTKFHGVMTPEWHIARLESEQNA